MKKRGRANFNEVRGNTSFLDQIFCRVCQMPVGPHDTRCGKCDHDFSFKDMEKAKTTQEELREQNKRNRKYTPPEVYI